MEKNVKKMIEYPKEGILSKEILKNSSYEISLFCMSAGTNIGDHTSTKKAIVYFIEGSGIFSLKEINIKIESGKLIFMERGAVHSLKVDKNTSFLLILVN